MANAFFKANMRMSNWVDRKLVAPQGRVLRRRFLADLEKGSIVADVGGGKKPIFAIDGFDEKTVETYDGLDIDIDELEQAAHIYDDIHVVDLTEDLPPELVGRYTDIMCLNTLEHVTDGVKSLDNLAKMLKPGGRLYIRVPYGLAAFTMLNRVLPNDFKKKVMHAVFPGKSGDGFPAYYDGCRPRQMTKTARSVGLDLLEAKKYYTSSYFTFLFPVYVLWRLFSGIQAIVDRDYCESYEIVFRKPV